MEELGEIRRLIGGCFCALGFKLTCVVETQANISGASSSYKKTKLLSAYVEKFKTLRLNKTAVSLTTSVFTPSNIPPYFHPDSLETLA